MLTITAGAGGFPVGRGTTVRIAAGVRALSGAGLTSDVSATFTGRPPTAVMQGYRRAAMVASSCVVRPDRASTPAMVKAFTSDIHYQPYLACRPRP